MSNSVEMAKAAFEKLVGESESPQDMNLALKTSQTYALIAIAEQLQLANRIELTGRGEQFLYDSEFGVDKLKPEVAELLGVKDV